MRKQDTRFKKFIQERRTMLGNRLAELSGTHMIVPLKQEQGILEDGEQFVIISHSVSIRKCGFRLHFREDFRNRDGNPYLYGFSYRLSAPLDAAGEKPIFRYECHPDVGDHENEDNEIAQVEDVKNFTSPYGLIPHFHADIMTIHPIMHLHFPFRRINRIDILVAIIEWLKVDLVHRYYDSGRVQSIK